MSDFTYTQELFRTLLAGIAPTAALVLGGRFLLDRFDENKKERDLQLEAKAKEGSLAFEMAKKRREQEIEVTRFVRQKQYDALQELYVLFAQFMCYFRIVNSNHVDLSLAPERLALLKEICAAEGRIDAAILRIASEFPQDESEGLQNHLADLRQSVQLWRESVRDGKRLPFFASDQKDYLRFKTAFVATCTHLASQVYGRLEPSKVVVASSTKTLTYVFSNQHEWHGQQ